MDAQTNDPYGKYFKKAPADAYFRFLTDDRHLLTDPTRENGREDPFALSLRKRRLSEYYFPRGDLEARMRSWQDEVITGRRGSGKTTILGKVADPVSEPEKKSPGQAGAPENEPGRPGEGGEPPIDNNDLVVTIPLHRSYEMVADEAFLSQGALSPLSVSVLPRYIMSEFFARFVFAPAERAGLLAGYRKKLDWMEALCWAYNTFPPLKPTFAEDFELMAWLSQFDTLSRRVTWPRTDQEKLERLIAFVTSPFESITGDELRRYRRVAVLVDDSEDLPHQAVERLLDDFARLVDTGYDRLCVKLFVDRRDEALVERLEPVRLGQVAVTEMPEWDEQDLKKLLLTRPLICTGQAPWKNWDEIALSDIENSISHDWTWKLVPHVFQKEARAPFLKKIIETALQVNDDVYDAPYHALRLTRAILWYAGATHKELNMRIVADMCARYWAGR